MRTRLRFLLLALILLSGCSSVKKSAVSSYSSVKGFLFPQVKLADAPVRQYDPPDEKDRRVHTAHAPSFMRSRGRRR